MDLAEVASKTNSSSSRSELEQLYLDMAATFSGPVRCKVPVAAAVQGHAIAGGLILPVACDFMALKTDSYKLGLTEFRVGVPFPPLIYDILKHRIPPRGLRKLTQSADLFTAEEAYEFGVGDLMCEDPLEEADKWLGHVTSFPSHAFQQTKKYEWDSILTKQVKLEFHNVSSAIV